MRTTSRRDMGRGMVGVSGRWSSKSKYISGLSDYTTFDGPVHVTVPTCRPRKLRLVSNVEIDDAEGQRDGVHV